MVNLWAAYIVDDSKATNRDDCDWLELSLRSVIDVVDKVMIIDGGCTPLLKQTLEKFPKEKIECVYVKYPGTDAQRNEYLKRIPIGDYILCIDSDEILGDNGSMLKEAIAKGPAECYNIRMHHFVYNLNLEDATNEKHYTPTRLFKNIEGLFYPDMKHTVLQGHKFIYNLDNIKLYHYGLAKGMLKIYKKIKDDFSKDRIPTHDDQFLRLWKHSLFFGTYPVKPTSVQHPKIIRNMFLD